MTATDDAQLTPATRRPFAAKYAHLGWGIGLAALGGFFVLVALGMMISGDAGASVMPLVLGLGAVAGSVYLLRGRGVDPRPAQRRAEAAERRALEAEAAIDQATRALGAAESRGAALVAFRNLQATARRYYPQEADAKVSKATDSIDFDMSVFASPRYGSVFATNGKALEVFRDYVIYDQEAHDVEMTTRGQVFVDGAIQVTSSVVLDKKNRQQVVNQQHDMRTANVQFTSATWSMSVPVAPDHANHVRGLVEQLATHVDTLKPRAASADDIQDMVKKIMNASGQPAAEKIKQLSLLRFDRLLDDTQFEAAKAKILDL